MTGAKMNESTISFACRMLSVSLQGSTWLHSIGVSDSGRKPPVIYVYTTTLMVPKNAIPRAFGGFTIMQRFMGEVKA
jgi:hypothetical protein